MHPDPGKAQAQREVAAFTPLDSVPLPGRPDVDLGGHADDAGQTQLIQALPKGGLGSIARVGQHAVPVGTLAEQTLDMRQRDGRLGGEDQVPPDARLVLLCQ